MRVIRIGDDMYVLRGSMRTDCGYSVEEIKEMHGVDSVLKKDDKWFAANKILDAEFEDIKLNKKKEYFIKEQYRSDFANKVELTNGDKYE